MTKSTLKWILPVSALFGTLLISLLLYKVTAKPHAFLTTSSPVGAYTVQLTGQKERPLLFTAKVSFHVLKNGKPFLSEKYLHSGDSGDLSFELGYPNHRWLNESTVQFYREEYFNDGKADTLGVVNNTGKPIKYVKIESVDKFLVFDLKPGFETRMLNSRPRGDSKWLRVVGEFSDGRSVVGNEATLPINKNLSGPFTYYIHIYEDKTTFEVRN